MVRIRKGFDVGFRDPRRHGAGGAAPTGRGPGSISAWRPACRRHLESETQPSKQILPLAAERQPWRVAVRIVDATTRSAVFIVTVPYFKGDAEMPQAGRGGGTPIRALGGNDDLTVAASTEWRRPFRVRTSAIRSSLLRPARPRRLPRASRTARRRPWLLPSGQHPPLSRFPTNDGVATSHRGPLFAGEASGGPRLPLKQPEEIDPWPTGRP